MSASEIGKSIQTAAGISSQADQTSPSKYSGRTIRDITRVVSTGVISTLATPLAMPLGAASAIAFGVPAALVWIANRIAPLSCKISEANQNPAAQAITPGTTKISSEIKRDFSAEKKSMSWEKYLAFQTRVSLLSMIPGFGLNLADCYRRTGSLKNFLKNDLVTNFLRSIGADGRSFIYQDTLRNQLNPAGCTIDGEHYSDEITELEQIIETHSKGTTIAHLRYPIEGGLELETTLLIPQGNTQDSPTVFYFHGNAETRFSIGTDLLHFTQKGYNVALCSYPGDYIMKADIAKDKNKRALPENKDTQNTTECSETKIIAATKGILNQFKQFGVNQIGVFGNSLGTGVAGHFIQQAIAMNQEEVNFTVDFALLKVPFSDAGSAAQHFVQNNAFGYGSCGQIVSAIAKGAIENYAEMEALESPGCDGLNTVNKIAGWKDASGMESTKIIVVTGLKDHIMGGKRKNTQYTANIKKYTQTKRENQEQLVKQEIKLQKLQNKQTFKNLQERALLSQLIESESAALNQNLTQIEQLAQDIQNNKKSLENYLAPHNQRLKTTEDNITASRKELGKVLALDGVKLRDDLTESEKAHYDQPFMAYRQLLETKLHLDQEQKRFDDWDRQIKQAETVYEEMKIKFEESRTRIETLSKKRLKLPALTSDEERYYLTTRNDIDQIQASIQALNTQIATLDKKIKNEPKFVYDAQENLGRKVDAAGEAADFKTVEIVSPSGGHGITLCYNDEAIQRVKEKPDQSHNSLMNLVQSELPWVQKSAYP